MKKSEARKIGFSQKKPTRPGIYFILDPHMILDPPMRLKQGWDLAEIEWKVDDYNGAPTPEGRWYLHTMTGLGLCWRKGMWLKGPIVPEVCGIEPMPKTFEDYLNENRKPQPAKREGR